MTSLASPQSSTAPFSPITPQRLQPGDTFIIQGPSVYRDITPPDDYPPRAPGSDYPARPIHEALIGPNGVAQSSSSWEIEVNQIFKPKPGAISQAVEAQIRKVGSNSTYPVLLHLSYHSMPTYPDPPLRQACDFGSFARTFPEVHAAYLHTYRSLQGREMMVCYGMLWANLGGNHVNVTIVEITNPRYITLAEWAEKFAGQGVHSSERPIFNLPSIEPGGVNLTASLLRTKINADFQNLRRFLSCQNRIIPELTIYQLKVDPSSTRTSLRYINRPLKASMTVEYAMASARFSYETYCSSENNNLSPIFRRQDFQTHLSGILLMFSQGHVEEEAVIAWKEIFILKARYNLSWDDSLPVVV